MSSQEPQVELLRRGGELVALSPLRSEELRERMRAALRARLGNYTRDPRDPANALIDALAACIDVLAFYHDRIATESKLGTAQLIESVSRLAEAVGFTPGAALAAVSYQFFEAVSKAALPSDTRVSGRGSETDPVAVFRTCRPIQIAPELNKMAPSPLLTRQTGAQRAILRRPQLAAAATVASPSVAAELFPGAVVIVTNKAAVELATIKSARSGGIAFERPLLRSYAEEEEEGELSDRCRVARATRIRQLRFGCDISSEAMLGRMSLVAFEVSEVPILHLPDADDPSVLQSTLEVFLFDPAAPVPPPRAWDQAARWKEVPDFTASEAADRHYRTFVDDRCRTYLVLRGSLGSRTLLDEAALNRVYVRYVPAIGEATQATATLALRTEYFNTTLVVPRRPERSTPTATARATWAYTNEAHGLDAGAQVAIFDDKNGDVYVRSLSHASGRYLRWGDGDTTVPALEKRPIPAGCDPEQWRIAPLASVASGQFYPLLQAFYVQLREPAHESVRAGADLKEGSALYQGATFLLLKKALDISPGDYVLVGVREKSAAREEDLPPPRARWVKAEVAQVIEQRGKLLRLKEPLRESHEDVLLNSTAHTAVIVPRVRSVYFGDKFSQEYELDDSTTFIRKSLTDSLKSSYWSVTLDTPIVPSEFVEKLQLQNLSTVAALNQIFMAVSRQCEAASETLWRFRLAVRLRGVPAQNIGELRLGNSDTAETGALIARSPITLEQAEGAEWITLNSPSDAISVRDHQGVVLLVPSGELTYAWGDSGTAPLRVARNAGWYFAPLSVNTQQLTAEGTLLVVASGAVVPYAFAYVAPFQSDVPGGLRLLSLDPADPVALPAGADLDHVIAVPGSSLELQEQHWWADWKLADDVFPTRLAWQLITNRLRIEFERVDLVRVFVEEGSASLVVHNVEIAGAPDPAKNCSAIFARPLGSALDLEGAALSAVWCFRVQLKGALPPGWCGSAVFKKNMLAVRDVSSEEKLVARLGQDLHELAKEPETVYLLHHSAGGATAAAVWQWAGSDLPSSLAEPHRALLLCLDPTDQSAGVRFHPWFASRDRLLLIATTSFPSAATVTSAYELYTDPIEIVSSTPAGSETELHFKLPASWPSGLTALPLLCVTEVAAADRIISLSDLQVDDSGGRARLAQSSIANWASARLIVADYASVVDKMLNELPAVRVQGAEWASDLAAQSFDVLIADFAFSDQANVAELERDAKPVSVIGQLVDGVWWLVRSDASTALPPGKRAYLRVGSGELKDLEVKTEITVSNFQYEDDVASTFEEVTLQLSSERRHFKLAKLAKITAQQPQWIATLDKHLREVVGDTVPSHLQLDFAYAQGSLSEQSECAGLHVIAQDLKADVLVFHDQSFSNLRVERLTADWKPAGSWSLASRDVGALFDATGRLLYPFVSAGQSWDEAQADAFVRRTLVLELPKSVLELRTGDRLVLTRNGAQQSSRIQAPLTGACYELGYEASPTAVRVSALAVTEPGAPQLAGEVSFAEPERPQDTWLLTLDPRSSSSIASGLLRWTPTSASEAGARRTFALSDLSALSTLRSGSDPLYYYTNQRHSLREDLYGNTSLPNFLFGQVPATALLVESDGPPPLVWQVPSQVLLCPIKWRAGADDRFFERKTTSAQPQSDRLKVFSTSLPFPSGDFIPVLGVEGSRDAAVIRNALRVRLLLPKREAVVIYEPRLSTLVEKIEQEKITSWAGVNTETKSWEKSGDDFFFYSFNKVPGGAFTLNFLLILPGDWQDRPKVKVYVEYGVNDSDDNAYKPEAELAVFNPSSQLMLQDGGDLKPRDYLFVHNLSSTIRTARVSAVDGPLVDIDVSVEENDNALPLPHEKIQMVAVHGLAKPRNPLKLDKTYYAWLKDAQFKDQRAALTDKLVVDPELVPFNGLFPGDHVLVLDRSYQDAWKRHRTSGDPTTSPAWQDWPEYQLVAKLKAVDWETGLITLDAPLPSRFAATIASGPDEAAIATTVEILPHYRSPLLGTRSRQVLGDGDVTRRFARYVGEFSSTDTFHKLAAMPLAANHAYAGNIELIVRDPRSGVLTRFTQFASIDDAEKKDRAFVPGVEPAAAAGTLSFSVQLGDGKKGQLPVTGTKNLFVRTTDISRVDATLPAERSVSLLNTEEGNHCPLQPNADDPVDNPCLTLESGAALAWCYEDSTVASEPCLPRGWRSLRIEIKRAGAELVPLSEITVDEARAGRDGFVLRAERPGVVKAKLFTSVPVTSDEVHVFEEAEASVWEPDWDYYKELAAQDIASKPGAQRLSVLETEGLEPGSILTFGTVDKPDLERAEVKSVAHETWTIELSQPLEREYPVTQSFLRGNTVPVVQGDTELVTLGSADGVSPSLRFAVKGRASLLHVADGDSDPVPALTVYIDATPWSRARDLATAGPRDHVWSLEREPDGRLFVVFGDGAHGAVPNAGVNNITARLHTGDGSSGNLAQKTITKLVDGNRAVKSTYNITDASGGRAAEDAQQAREALLSRNVAFDRVVCVGDVERAAYELGEVEHARVDPTAERGTLRLVVSLTRRREPSERTKQLIVERVLQRMPATAALTVNVTAARQYAVIVSVEVVINADYVATAVLAQLNHAFRASDGGFFSCERWNIGEPLRLGDIYESVFAVEGVATANVTQLRSKEPGAPDLCEVGSINPGPEGVIRCDSDLVNDHELARGAIIFTPVAGGRT